MVPDISFIEDIVVAITTLIFIFTMIGAIFAYVVGSIGLFNVLKLQGYEKPWKAFVPFTRDYLEGDIISDLLGAEGKKDAMIKTCFVGGCVLSVVISVVLKLIKPYINLDILNADIKTWALVAGLLLFLIFTLMSIVIAISSFGLRTVALYRVGYHPVVAFLITWFLTNFWLFFVWYKLKRHSGWSEGPNFDFKVSGEEE